MSKRTTLFEKLIFKIILYRIKLHFCVNKTQALPRRLDKCFIISITTFKI